MQNDFLSRTIKIQKLFNFNEGSCFYSNVESETKNIKNDQDSQIKISNNFCKEVGNSLIKITEVRFGQRVIYIEDSYRFIGTDSPEKIRNNSLQPTNSSDSSNNNNNKLKDSPNQQQAEPTLKKKMIFKRNNLDTLSSKRRNTKNIAKNFCKAFLSYLQNKRVKQALSQAKKLVLLHNYNNKSIEKLAVNNVTKKQFKQFLSNKAEQWITSSKIHDKDVHTSAIQLYLQLIDRYQNEEGPADQNQQNQDKSVFYSDQASENLEQKVYSQ